MRGNSKSGRIPLISWHLSYMRWLKTAIRFSISNYRCLVGYAIFLLLILTLGGRGEVVCSALVFIFTVYLFTRVYICWADSLVEYTENSRICTSHHLSMALMYSMRWIHSVINVLDTVCHCSLSRSQSF